LLKSIIDQANKLQSNQIFAFQPKQWPGKTLYFVSKHLFSFIIETSKQTQQSSPINPSSEIQNTQFELNQKQEGLLIKPICSYKILL
jgi:hypothetical protein